MFENLISIAIVIGFAVFVYAGFTKKTFKQAFGDIIEFCKLPGDDEEE